MNNTPCVRRLPMLFEGQSSHLTCSSLSEAPWVGKLRIQVDRPTRRVLGALQDASENVSEIAAAGRWAILRHPPVDGSKRDVRHRR